MREYRDDQLTLKMDASLRDISGKSTDLRPGVAFEVGSKSTDFAKAAVPRQRRIGVTFLLLCKFACMSMAISV